MVYVKRTFHPVGQGAFYTEVFYNEDRSRFIMVYDCGTETGEKNMEVSLDDQIDLFKKRKLHISQIDILFISHFHADHINGLKRLLENVRIKKTVIPMLDEPAIIATRVHNHLRYSRNNAEAVDKVIEDLYHGGKGSERFGEIVVVGPDKRDEPQILEDGWVRAPRVKTRWYSGDRIPVNKYWEFIPFNSIKFNDPRALDLITRIDFHFGLNYNLDYLIKNYLSSLKDIYRKAMGSTNDNLYTLVVVSQPVDGVKPMPKPRLAHCIYMGDFDYRQSADPWERLKGVINYDEIGMVQVPHHGAKGNWLSEMGDGKRRHYIVSSGTTNGYHHPNYWVLHEIMDKGHKVIVVSEKKASRKAYMFEVDYGKDKQGIERDTETENVTTE